MNTKEMLTKYIKSFRVECYFLVENTGGGMPVGQYNKAYENAKNEIVEELNLTDDDIKKIDAIHRTFISKVLELENYNDAEDYVFGVIEKL